MPRLCRSYLATYSVLEVLFLVHYCPYQLLLPVFHIFHQPLVVLHQIRVFQLNAGRKERRLAVSWVEVELQRFLPVALYTSLCQVVRGILWWVVDVLCNASCERLVC